VRPLRRRVDRQGVTDPADGQPAPRGGGVGQHVQQVRPGQPVRRLQGVGPRPRGRQARTGGLPQVTRADVRKTYKLYIGGAFPRAESGHSYVVEDATGRFLANAALASRKDARDAVVAARGAFGGWSGRTAYNRGQVVYRIAEVMEDRRPQFVDALGSSEGLSSRQAPPGLNAPGTRVA